MPGLDLAFDEARRVMFDVTDGDPNALLPALFVLDDNEDALQGALEGEDAVIGLGRLAGGALVLARRVAVTSLSAEQIDEELVRAVADVPVHAGLSRAERARLVERARGLLVELREQVAPLARGDNDFSA